MERWSKKKSQLPLDKSHKIKPSIFYLLRMVPFMTWTATNGCTIIIITPIPFRGSFAEQKAYCSIVLHFVNAFYCSMNDIVQHGWSTLQIPLCTRGGPFVPPLQKIGF